MTDNSQGTSDSAKDKSPATKFITYMNNNRDVLDLFFMFLRNTIPNLVLPNNGPAFITRFRDVQEALDRPDVFTVIYGPAIDACVGPFMLGRDDTIFNQRDKGIMKSMISSQDMPKVRSIVARLVDEAVGKQLQNQSIELVSTVSRHVPLRLTGEYFGFPGPDLESLARWSKSTQLDIFYNIDSDSKTRQNSVDSGIEMKAYLKQLIKQRRKELKTNPELDDVLSRLLRSTFPEEIHFDDERIIANIMGTLVGGIETTSLCVVQIMEQLLKRPRELQGAIHAAEANNDKLVYQYCWEALRFRAQTPFVPRKCARDYKIAAGTLRSKVIKQGTDVLICIESAMKDGREIPAAAQFCIDRPAYHYLHLGYGMHSCLGEQVSKVQIPEIVKRLLKLPNLRQETKPDFKGGPFIESYVLRFDSA